MHKPDIASATVLPKMGGVLKDDISALKGMLQARTTDSYLSPLLQSMIDVKLYMQSIILTYKRGLDEVPVPAGTLPLSSYDKTKGAVVKDRIRLLSILAQIERDQLDFLRRAAVTPGMPKTIQTLVERLQAISTQVVDQLDSMKRMQQVKSIQLVL